MAKLTLFAAPDDSSDFDPGQEYEFVESVGGAAAEDKDKEVFAIMEFEKPVPVVPKCKGEEVLSLCVESRIFLYFIISFSSRFTSGL